jgi:hypothetical protein
MTEQVEITGLSRVAKPKPNRTGCTIIAFFDCIARGIEFHGCALVRTKAGGLVAWPPKIDVDHASRNRVIIRDDSLRHGMMLHAREAYRALGGTDAEWIGKCIPEGPNAFERLEREFD